MAAGATESEAGREWYARDLPAPQPLAMTERLEHSPSSPPSEPAATLAGSLAASLATHLESSRPEIDGLARAMSLDRTRVHAELAYLLVVTTQFCIGAAVDEDAEPRLQAAFESAALAAAALAITPRGLRVRVREYRDALQHPHPEFGRPYSVGRVFARYCDASRELAVIEFAASTYMAQLPPTLARLRAVRVA